MFGLDILDVAIGLALFFLIVSLICSAVREALEGLLKLRSRNLERGIRELLDDPSGETLARSIYEHGQIYSLFAGDYDAAKLGWKKSQLFTRPWGAFQKWRAGRRLPSYIPAGQFANALIDIVGRGPASPYPTPTGQITLDQLRARAAELPSPRVQRAVLAAIDHAEGDLQKAKANVELWFDGSMDRVSGWYKRSTQMWLFVIGLAAAALLNLDALTVAHRLTEDKVLREAFVAQAEKYTAPAAAGGSATSNVAAPDAASGSRVADPAATPPAKTIPELRRDLASIGAPTGWTALKSETIVIRNGKPEKVARTDRYPGPQYQAYCQSSRDKCRTAPPTGWWISILLGWLVTAVAVTFGAPFWFDVLNKFMVVRATVKPREKSREEGSEDRKSPPPAPAGGPAVANPPPGGGGGQPAAAAASPPPAPDPAEQGFQPEEWAQGRENMDEIKL